MGEVPPGPGSRLGSCRTPSRATTGPRSYHPLRRRPGESRMRPGPVGSVVVHVYRVAPVLAVGRDRDAQPVAGRLVQQVVQPPLGGVVAPLRVAGLQHEAREVAETVVADLGDLTGDPAGGVRLVIRFAAVLRIAAERAYPVGQHIEVPGEDRLPAVARRDAPADLPQYRQIALLGRDDLARGADRDGDLEAAGDGPVRAGHLVRGDPVQLASAYRRWELDGEQPGQVRPVASRDR